MPVPKRKKSKSKMRTRKRSHRRPVPAVQACPNCGADSQPHRACPSCGRYGDRQVVTVEADE